ncbi:MAG: DsbA family protein [Nitrospirae bacterium]|nr:DsbA family protein [Nitrospirota bacterium]MBI3352828.1 DsbA family protein [Nitrospirota bacterium]
MKKNKSLNQKKEKETKSQSKKNRRLYNRVAMGVMMVLVLLVIVYSVKSIRPVDLSDPGNRPFKGNPNSKVIVSEFSDFQCPACRGAESNLKQLLADYPEKIKFVFYNYPLTQNHQWAMVAAEAAQCANDQGKFWPYHDLLYDRQEIWAKDSAAEKTFKIYAGELGLNAEIFNACLDQEKKKSVISEDVDRGDALQIQSTPTIFINKQRVIGGNSLFELKQAVENELNLRS